MLTCKLHTHTGLVYERCGVYKRCNLPMEDNVQVPGMTNEAIGRYFLY